jgi:Lrp/AsnC family leucine-responsive transcriptional regulator
MVNIDDTDLLILQTLNKNSKASIYQLSKQTGIPSTTVHNRIKKLEESKVIKSYTIDVDYAQLDRNIIVYILTTYDMKAMERAGLSVEGLTKLLRKMPEIEDIAYVSGRFDIILKVRLRNIKSLGSLVLDRIRKIPGIGHTESIFSLFYETERRI